MKMSTKGRYAVMAMIDIASYSDGEPVSLAEIAERQDISQEYLEQLFGKLRKAKLVESARGPGGGYRLATPMSEIPVARIIAAVDEELQFTRCDGDAVEGCVKGERCNAHDLWSSLGRQMMYFLSSISLEDVVEKRNLALAATIKQTKDRHPEGSPA
ncbi:MAG: Rrf2 family transcriptional regulator [Aestuariivirga sp.]|uniref:Rrf2 family transcriptional regulator n=1 Tax=Aestuariivirga sp. TaxID=2650926 RepID=UPI0025C49A95|nr:Rrf2 family transcriptional regulator [Aestuariivirga sp.]MCA3561269.1 Rrf2 family transcriptional regulator [Aestuariivirga sp.]